jgi:DNA-directed RNA polymerase
LVVHEGRTEWEKRHEGLARIAATWDYDTARRYLKNVEMNPERWPHEAQLRVGQHLLREALVSNALWSVRRSGGGKARYREVLELASSRNVNGLRTVYQMPELENGIFALGYRIEHKKTHALVRLTDSAFEALINGHLGAEYLNATNAPMVIPPGEWTTDHDGGYKLLRTDLVKPVGFNSNVDGGVSDNVRAAVNQMQRTTWMVDQRVTDIIQLVWDRGGDRCGLPSREKAEMPARSVTEDPTEIAANKMERKFAWDAWYKAQSKRMSVSMTLSESKMLEKLPVYFVWTMDFRGRMYPMADNLTPQGADYQKAALVFEQAKPIQFSEQEDWLKINLANLFGVDKVSMDERVQWVDDNTYKIKEAMRDPMRYIDWWGEADKPFCFYAACLDYLDYLSTGCSRIPVAMDGSCNGIQHLSALGRDKRGAQATNLLHSYQPADIYQEVADELFPLIQADDSEYRQLFPLERVTRKLCKRATMTTPYGVTRQGIRTQFVTDGHLSHLPPEQQGEISSWLTGLATVAIGSVVTSAREVMDWLQLLAVEANKRGLPLTWDTPDGKVVTQDYLNKREYTVRIPGMGKTTFHINDETLGINKNSQRNGMAPNFIHSLDACHARMTGRDMAVVTDDLGFVHDSFSCHAVHAPFMSYLIRETFIDMHKQPLLERLHASTQIQLDCTLPAPPIVGDFNVSLVSGAEYFFA